MSPAHGAGREPRDASFIDQTTSAPTSPPKRGDRTAQPSGANHALDASRADERGGVVARADVRDSLDARLRRYQIGQVEGSSSWARPHPIDRQSGPHSEVGSPPVWAPAWAAIEEIDVGAQTAHSRQVIFVEDRFGGAQARTRRNHALLHVERAPPRRCSRRGTHARAILDVARRAMTRYRETFSPSPRRLCRLHGHA